MKHKVDSQRAVEDVTGRCPANCDVTPRQWSNSRHGHACALFHHLRLRTRPDGPRVQKIVRGRIEECAHYNYNYSILQQIQCSRYSFGLKSIKLPR